MCESGALAENEVTVYSYVTAGAYSLFIDMGADWLLNAAQIPDSMFEEMECTFEAGKRYDYGTNGGAMMSVAEKQKRTMVYDINLHSGRLYFVIIAGELDIYCITTDRTGEERLTRIQCPISIIIIFTIILGEKENGKG